MRSVPRASFSEADLSYTSCAVFLRVLLLLSSSLLIFILIHARFARCLSLSSSLLMLVIIHDGFATCLFVVVVCVVNFCSHNTGFARCFLAVVVVYVVNFCSHTRWFLWGSFLAASDFKIAMRSAKAAIGNTNEPDSLSFFLCALRPRRRDGLLGTGTEWEGDDRVKARPRKPPEKDRRERGPPPEQWKC